MNSSCCQWAMEYLHAQQISPEYTLLSMVCALAACFGYVLYFMSDCQALRLSSSQAQWLYGWFTKVTLFKRAPLGESKKRSSCSSGSLQHAIFGPGMCWRQRNKRFWDVLWLSQIIYYLLEVVTKAVPDHF